MSRVVLSIITALAFSVGMAVAQSAGSAGAQGTQSGSPSNQGTTGTSGMGRPDGNNPNMGQGQDQNTTGNMNNSTKGEKKLKGCVQSQGGQTMLETKKGKDIALTGQDLSAHNGHEVEVKGTWETAGGAGMSQSSTGTSASGEKTFNVTDVKMISETCSGKTKGSSMGTTPGAGNSTGSSTGTTGSGTSSGSPGTQPQ